MEGIEMILFGTGEKSQWSFKKCMMMKDDEYVKMYHVTVFFCLPSQAKLDKFRQLHALKPLPLCTPKARSIIGHTELHVFLCGHCVRQI